ncbi:MAG: TolC family protein [Proteobacteria bacterium]|jgi:outer membrane protein TolC|nr:TolC family protein [Pseudomonadota bacterium]MBT5227016.1 TolC family protein [Pseudomonadota bacterium]MBT5816888.1 TolC family protein [Pseudomonadota bacterium]MBT6349939.1 TolC family protein [Pseudomonadota bacterium]|tara:strand:+ start:1288 stop:2613 length:1326 start_codon:yes stop_codon:yes gene_type:complete
MKLADRKLLRSIGIAALLWPLSVSSQSDSAKPPLPEPLRLTDALRLGATAHPEIMMAESGVNAAKINLGKVDSSYGFDAFVELQPRLSSRAASDDVNFNDDSRYGLVVKKRLTDFGRTESRKEAARSDVAANEAHFVTRRDRHMLNIMRSFFAVILADHAYQALNERLAIDYFRYTRMAERRDRFEQYSDLEVAEQEAAYRKVYVARHRADLERRQRRHALALRLGRPGELSSELLMPDLSAYQVREIPEYNDVVEQVIVNSSILNTHRASVASAQAKVEVAEKLNSPVLSADFEAREYHDSSFSSRDRYRLNLKFMMPLFNGTRTRDSEVALAENALVQEQAELLAAEYLVREDVMTLISNLLVNRAAAVAAEADETYRGYYQDRSRAMYEMEMRSDLGDAQAAAAEALLEVTRVDFEQALLWAQMDALLARPIALLEEK